MITQGTGTRKARTNDHNQLLRQHNPLYHLLIPLYGTTVTLHPLIYGIFPPLLYSPPSLGAWMEFALAVIHIVGKTPVIEL